MKKNKILLTLLALAIVFCLLVGALAESPYAAIWNAGTDLAIKTSNAEIHLNADFSYEGELFKQTKVSYIKDGLDNLLTVNMFTPKVDGTVQETGYTVLGKEGEAWSYDIGDETAYSIGIDPSTSIIRSTGMRNMLTLSGNVVTAAAEIMAGDKISTAAGENGSTVYTVKMGGEDIPDVLNSTLYTLLNVAADRYGYCYGELGYMAEYAEYDSQFEYEDYDANFRLAYETLTGEAYPDDFWYNYDIDEDSDFWARLEAIYDSLYALEEEIAEENPDAGYVVIKPDNTYVCYGSFADYLLENNLQYVLYDDRAATFAAYYKEKTGEELDPWAYEACVRYINADLYDAMWSMMSEMDDVYRSQCRAQEGALCVIVDANSNCRYIMDEDDLALYTTDDTLIRTLLGLTSGISMENIDIETTLDNSGRLTAVSGTVVFGLTMMTGKSHPLTVTFDMTVEYDKADLSKTTYEVLGVQLWEDWFEENYGGDFDKLWEDEVNKAIHDVEDEEPFPETVTFLGVEYKIEDVSYDNYEYNYEFGD